MNGQALGPLNCKGCLHDLLYTSTQDVKIMA